MYYLFGENVVTRGLQILNPICCLRVSFLLADLVFVVTLYRIQLLQRKKSKAMGD